MSAHKTVIDALVLRLMRSTPLTGMRRAQIVYLLRAQMGAAGLHVGTNDLLKFVDEIIRRETTTKDGYVVDRDRIISQTFGDAAAENSIG